MFTLITDGTITKHISGNKGITLGDIQYPKSIFTLWSAAEREAIGIYEIVFDDSNKKDEKWYINTNQTFAFANDTVTASYGTATPKAHADTLFTAQDEIDELGVEGEIATRGLKYNLIKDLKINVANELAKTDWYITRNTEKTTAIPSSISTHRDSVRTTQASIEAQITGALDTAALETLHTYTTTDGVQSRPLGELPVLES
jgi:hypothetical protein